MEKITRTVRKINHKNRNVYHVMCLSNNVTNKAHKFMGHKYIYYSTSPTCIGPRGNLQGCPSNIREWFLRFLHYFNYSKSTKHSNTPTPTNAHSLGHSTLLRETHHYTAQGPDPFGFKAPIIMFLCIQPHTI